MEDERWKMEDGRCKMKAGRWKMQDESWKMKDGRWKMEDGRWKMEDGRWKMEDGRWKMEDGRWKMEASINLQINMNEKTLELLNRTFKFGIRILKFLNALPDNYIYRIPKGQLARSAVSPGTNYEEAQGAVSRRDFTHKISICYKESRESIYWLKVLKELYPEEKYNLEFEDIIKEAKELKKIFASIKKSSSENIVKS